MTDPTAQSSEPLPRAASSPGPRVGEQAPDFNLEAIDGAIVRLSDLRGQPVILNFWAPWCVPCREALPILQAARNDDLNILGIAVRESRDSVLASAAELGLEFPLLLDQNGQVSDAYQVRGLPVSLFVDPEGTIRIRHVGPLDQATLEGYLAVLLPTAPAFPPAP